MTEVTETIRRAALAESFGILDALKVIGIELPDDTGVQQVKCPFHPDTRPSARIYEDHLYCFTCARGWDAVGVIRQSYGLTTEAALDWIEAEFNIDSPLVGLVRSTKALLRATPPIDLEPLFAHVEQRLLAARSHLTRKQFANYTTAADVYRWQFQNKEVTAEECVPLLHALVERCEERHEQIDARLCVDAGLTQ